MSKTVLFMRRHAQATCDGAKWDESKHKRDSGGKFSSTGGGGGAKKDSGARKDKAKPAASAKQEKREEIHDTAKPPDAWARRWLERRCRAFERSAKWCKTKSDIRSLASSYNYERPLWARLAIRALARKFMEELDKAKGPTAPTEQPPKTGIHKYLGLYLQRHGAKPTRPSVKELAKKLAKHTPDVRAYADGILAHEDDEHYLRDTARYLGYEMKVEHRSGKSIFFSVKKR